MTGIHDPVKLTEKVVSFLNDKYHRDDRSAAEFSMMIAHAHLGRLMSKPVLAMQLIHQYYVGKFDNRVVSDADTTQLALYSNMVDMLLGHADGEDTHVQTTKNQATELPDYFDHFENIQDSKHLVIAISNLAFTTLLKQNKQCAIVYDKDTICKIINDHEMKLFLTAGILTQKQFIGLRFKENKSYMFLHKTLQENLAALHMLISRDDNNEYMSLIKENFNEPCSVLDCSQLFTFTCALNPVLAEHMSSCMMDVITADCHDRVERGVDPDFKLIENAQKLIAIGFVEGRANGLSMSLTLTHFTIGGSSPAMSPFAERPKMDMLYCAAKCGVKSLNIRGMHHDMYALSNLQLFSASSKHTLEFLAVRDIHLKLFDLTKLKYLFVCRNSAYYEMMHLPVNFTEVQNQIADEFISKTLPQLSVWRVVLYWIQLGDKQMTLPRSVRSICLYDVAISEWSRQHLMEWADENKIEFKVLDKIEF
ncbi:hypothetical protein DPMN_143074 [Dreissena polymorpha]|uniref:Uncharacterized protein n=1 Tax=Dreissena polymorpha TaxID=45954 RepID=A0A9D4GCH4_DREPO|nr:hypothetical protein DPMN_143074 [Dreissena polymorpha]